MEKGFTIRELTARGWTRREDLDFRDDGNKFKVFEYKNGLLASYTKVNGDYYLSLRLDYLDGLSYDEYSKMDSYELTNEFNGVPEVDADKVTENAVKIMEEYNKVLEEVNKHEVDIDGLIDAAEEELKLVHNILNESNIGIDELDGFSSYEITKLREYRNSIKTQAESKLNRLMSGGYSKKELRNLEHRLEKFGYLTINEKDSFYIREIRNIIRKAKGNQ